MKQLTAVLLAMALLLTCALAEEDSDPVGTWYGYRANVNGEDMSASRLFGSASAILRADGSACVILSGATQLGTWEMDGRDIVLLLNGTRREASIGRGVLTIEFDGIKVTFLREDASDGDYAYSAFGEEDIPDTWYLNRVDCYGEVSYIRTSDVLSHQELVLTADGCAEYFVAGISDGVYSWAMSDGCILIDQIGDDGGMVQRSAGIADGVLVVRVSDDLVLLYDREPIFADMAGDR